MKHRLMGLVILIVLFSCSTSSEVSVTAADQIVLDFARGLENQDIDLLMSAYHDDAEFTFTAPDGTKDHIVGKPAIREGQLGGFQGEAPDVLTDEWRVAAVGTERVYEVIVQFGGGELRLLNTLAVTEAGGKWGVIRQTVEFRE